MANAYLPQMNTPRPMPGRVPRIRNTYTPPGRNTNQRLPRNMHGPTNAGTNAPPGQARPPVPRVATAPGTLPAATNTHPTPSPLDAQYYADLASATFNANNRINALNTQSGYAQTDLGTALANLQRQQPIDTLNLQTSANKQGLLYSGQLGQNVGRLNQSYLDRQAADQQQFTRGQAARDAAIAALRGGLPLTAAALAAAAAERASLAAANDPTLGVETPAVPALGAGAGAHPGARNTHGPTNRGTNAPPGQGWMIVPRAPARGPAPREPRVRFNTPPPRVPAKFRGGPVRRSGRNVY